MTAAGRGHTCVRPAVRAGATREDTAMSDAVPSGYPDLGPQPVPDVRVFTVPAVPTAVVRAKGMPTATIDGLFDAVFGSALPEAFHRGVVPVGPALALYTSIGDGPEGVADVEIGFPVARALEQPIVADELTVEPSVAAGGQGGGGQSPRCVRPARRGVGELPGRDRREGRYPRGPVLGGLRDRADPGHGPRDTAHRPLLPAGRHGRRRLSRRVAAASPFAALTPAPNEPCRALSGLVGSCRTLPTHSNTCTIVRRFDTGDVGVDDGRHGG